MRHQAEVDAALENLMSELGRELTAAEVIPVALMRSADLLGADLVRLAVADGTDVTCWGYAHGAVSCEPPTDLDATLRDVSSCRPGEVIQHKATVDGRPGRWLIRQTPQLEGGVFTFAVARTGRRGFDDSARQVMRRISALVIRTLAKVQQVACLVERAVDLEHQAAHDPLTGLANRSRFQEAAGAAVQDRRAGAVLLIDLDRFKEVNDTLGHHVGDQVLVEVAKRIRDTVRSGSLIARLGGDEFAILLEPAGRDDLVSVALQLHGRLESPVDVSAFAVDVGASIGMALATTEVSTLGTLLRRADVAMYAAKEARKPIELYRPELDHYRPEALALVPRFRGAVEHDELQVAFQAQYDAHHERIVGAEALARWSVSGHGPVSPTEFIPIAERTGLIHPLTQRIMAEAVGQCAGWEADVDQLRVSVNITPRVLVEPGFAQRVDDQLRRAGLPPQRLRVEVTETTIMSHPERAVAALHELCERGVTVAIDDFGTGHSSLSYLTTLPCDELKIERGFIEAMDNGDRRAVAVVAAIIGLARDLGIDVVAEGVETERSSDQLQQMGCRIFQGFLYSRPVSASEFSRVLAGTPTARGGLLAERRRSRGDASSAEGWAAGRGPAPLAVPGSGLGQALIDL